MRKEKHYDQEYCVGLIRSALLPRGKNPEINACSLKLLILAKVEYLQEQYGLDTEDLFSEISRHFLEKKIIHKINPKNRNSNRKLTHFDSRKLTHPRFLFFGSLLLSNRVFPYWQLAGNGGSP
jgi:hypothetical protein